MLTQFIADQVVAFQYGCYRKANGKRRCEKDLECKQLITQIAVDKMDRSVVEGGRDRGDDRDLNDRKRRSDASLPKCMQDNHRYHDE